MLNGIQHKISQVSGLSEPFISLVLNGHRRPGWKSAKKLAQATHTDPILWLEGEPAEMRQALAELKIEYKITLSKKADEKKRVKNRRQ